MRVNRRIIFSLVIVSLLFLSLIGYLTYFILFESAEIAKSPYDKRSWAYEEDVLRGNITDRYGVVLASSSMTENGQVRDYPFKNLYCHVIGYNSRTYGKSQLESRFNNLLLGKDELTNVAGFEIIKREGYDLQLTIDNRLQQKASEMLEGYKGAVVAMNPQTGEILTMVSKPDFNPNESVLIKDWTALTEDTDSPLLPRAVSGLYPPGSTFKIITTVAAIEGGLETMTFEDEGAYHADGQKIENYQHKAMGSLDLKEAFAKSSNVAFAYISEKLGADAIRSTAAKFGFNNKIDFDLSCSKTTLPEGNLGKIGTAALSIGQSSVTATPLQMLMAVSAIANGGIIQRPYLVSKSTSKSGMTIYEQKPVTAGRATDGLTAAKIGKMMEYTVSNGTGGTAAIKGLTVAGKTGTAENENKQKNHAWFVSYAPGENPNIAVAVILENSGGTGGELAAPIARELMKIQNGK